MLPHHATADSGDCPAQDHRGTGKAGTLGLQRADDDEQPDDAGVERLQRPARARDELGGQHPHPAATDGGEQVAVVARRRRHLAEQEITADAAAEPYEDREHRDPEEVKVALVAELRPEGTALHGAEGHRGQVKPQRDVGEVLGHM
jgi:hypothetical protein